MSSDGYMRLYKVEEDARNEWDAAVLDDNKTPGEIEDLRMIWKKAEFRRRMWDAGQKHQH